MKWETTPMFVPPTRVVSFASAVLPSAVPTHFWDNQSEMITFIFFCFEQNTSRSQKKAHLLWNRQQDANFLDFSASAEHNNNRKGKLLHLLYNFSLFLTVLLLFVVLWPKEGDFPENLHRVVCVVYVFGSYFRTLAVILVSDFFLLLFSTE